MHGIASPSLGPIRPTRSQREQRRREKLRLARSRPRRLAQLRNSEQGDWELSYNDSTEELGNNEEWSGASSLHDDDSSMGEENDGEARSSKKLTVKKQKHTRGKKRTQDKELEELASNVASFPSLELPSNASSTLKSRPRRNSLSEMSEVSTFSTSCADLGELAAGTVSAESQLSRVYGADTAMKELQKLATAGDSYAVALVDVLDVLDAAETNRFLESKLRYITQDVLASAWREEDQQGRVVEECKSVGEGGDERKALVHVENMERYVVTRVVLGQVEVLIQELLSFLVELSGHLEFWKELEDTPMRRNLIWFGRRLWRSIMNLFKRIDADNSETSLLSLEEIIAYLEDLSLLYTERLGQLKELLLQFEELDSVDALQYMTVVCIEQVKVVLGISLPPANMSREKRFDRHGLLHYFAQYHDAIRKQRSTLRTYLKGYEELPRYVKYWPEVSAGIMVGVGLVYFGVQHQAETIEFLVRVSDSWNEFYMEHVKKPLAALVDEIVFDHTLCVADQEATTDAKESLGRMLHDYVLDIDPKIDPDTLHSIVERLDVSIISKQYEEELKKPFTSLVSGDLVRMLLIQMQFMKKELLVVMTALDELIRENQFNLEVMATIPAFIVSWSVYQLGLQVVNAIRGSKSTKRYVFVQVRLMLRDVEQLLNLNNQDKKLLRGVSLGRLVLLLHQLETLVLSYESFFDRHERKRLAEDVSELLSDHLVIPQKLNTIQRMYRSYTFLQPTNRNLEALLRRLL